MIIPAVYFDGKTSQRHAVELMHHNGLIAIAGDIRRSWKASDVRVLERSGNKVGKLAFPNGAYLEVADAAAFDAFLTEIGYRDPIAIRLHRSWRWVLGAVVALVAILVPSYIFGLPLAADWIAKQMPETAQHAIGREALGFLDQHLFSASELSPTRQQAIIGRFQLLKLPQMGTPTYSILFRKSRVGPNAFALPSGQIVLTDELVNLLDDDEAVMGVLAHEMGHLHERHLLRRIIQGSAVGLASVVLFGDASSVVAAIPTTMMDMKYSRDAEREADDYAIAMMQTNGIGLNKLAMTFEKLGKQTPEMSAYLSSHPSATERIERIRQAELTAVAQTPAPTASAPRVGTSESAPKLVEAALLIGEWMPDENAYVRSAHRQDGRSTSEDSLRERSRNTRVIFKQGNIVHFQFPDNRSDFSYRVKSESGGCYELSIVELGNNQAELGHYLTCVNGNVMMMESRETGVTEHYVRG